MTGPLEDIENRKANEDMGRMAVQVFAGARDEADTWAEAFWATVAYFVGMFKQANEPTEPTDETT